MALIHIYIVVLEMVLWTRARRARLSASLPNSPRQTKALAANQGLYNGFLAAGLIWGLLHPDPDFGWQIQMFFLACVAVAGIFGAATAKRSILFVQTVPAVIAMIAVVLA